MDLNKLVDFSYVALPVLTCIWLAVKIIKSLF